MSPEEKSAWKPKDAAIVTTADSAGGGGGDSASKEPMEVEA